jgi:hypothetical protein
MATEPKNERQHQSKPPRRNWNATVRPHWIELLLAAMLVIVGASQVGIYFRQASIMDNQADIARQQLAIAENQIRPRIVFEPHVSEDNTHTFWRITPTWTNKGQSDAVTFEAWGSLDFFTPNLAPSGKTLAATPFQAYQNSTGKKVIPADEGITFQSRDVTMKQAEDQFNGRLVILMWGYTRWQDPTPKSPVHSRRWCYRINFTMFDGKLAMKLPQFYDPECNRTEYEP